MNSEFSSRKGLTEARKEYTVYTERFGGRGDASSGQSRNDASCEC